MGNNMGWNFRTDYAGKLPRQTVQREITCKICGKVFTWNGGKRYCPDCMEYLKRRSDNEE